MRVELKGFATDSDVDFVLVSESTSEAVLLRAMRARDLLLIFPSGPSVSTSTATVRMSVRGKRV